MSSWGGLLLPESLPSFVIVCKAASFFTNSGFFFPSTFFQRQSTHGNLDDFSIKVVMSIVAE
jgi:hypothetical protein